MAGISSTTGLATGIDSKSIIDQLIALEEKPKTDLQARMDTENKKKAAYADLQIRLTSLRLFGTTMKKPQSFRAADVKSGDESIVTGTAATGAAAGSYQLSVARLVTAQQSVSKGFADYDSTAVGAGQITLELGGGNLNEPTNLDDLNGGDGVRRGQFRITDRSGKSTLIDTTSAITLDDVVDKINQSLDVSVHAEVKNDGIVLTDQTGAILNDFRIDDVGTGHAAEDLGIKQDVAVNSITGTSLGGLKTTTALSKLNDGRGIGVATAGADLHITTGGNGAGVDVTLSGSKTIGDVLTRINTALGNAGTASLSNDGKSISVNSSSRGTVTLTAVGTSTAAADLGLTNNIAAANTVTGTALTAGVDSTLLRSLRGGAGISLGQIQIVDRNGATNDVDLSGAATINDVLDKINASGSNIVASVQPGANGITITDKTDKLGALKITDLNGGSSAAELGIATPAAGVANNTITGANLQKAWFGRSTQLSDLNGGKGVPDGSFTIADSTGKTETIKITSTTIANIGDLMDKINASTNVGVKASINANGDGLLLTDTANGALKMAVKDTDGGTTAKSLNIVGIAAATTLDGTWEKKIDILATDKLQDLQKKIQDANFGLSASIINDGSKDAPYRLSLTATNTGRAGRVTFGSGNVDLGARVLVSAQDAAVFVGASSSGSSDAQPLLITASSNTISGAIRGVTLNLAGVSKEPVTVNVAPNVDNVATSASKFVEDFNGLVTQLQTYTKYDSDTGTRGELLGDPVAQDVETQIYGMLNTVGAKSGKYRIPADVGFSVGDGGAIEFDEDKFRAAYADDPAGVTALFTAGGAAIDSDYKTQDLRNGQGLRTNADGVADFRIDTKAGTGFDVDIGVAATMGDVINAINNATGNAGKATAAFNATGTGIDIIDNSATGTKKLLVSTLNGSIAAGDLGLLVTAANNKISGKALISQNAGNTGGIGTVIEKRINRLIDPTNGAVSRASADVDTQNAQFQDRIDSIDKLVDAKRARLEKQFADMETAISNLQSQQASLGSLSTASK